MANEFAIHSVGESLRRYLENLYPAALRDRHACSFKLLSSGELIDTANLGTTLSLFLFRVTMNEHLRNSPRPGRVFEATPPLAVDLHYLMTMWANNAMAEHTILSWAMRELHRHPILDQSSLSGDAQWNAGDVIRVIPTELSNEDIMRVWDALNPPYHLSVSYIARVVRIDTGAFEDSRVVVANRFSYMERGVPT